VGALFSVHLNLWVELMVRDVALFGAVSTAWSAWQPARQYLTVLSLRVQHS
jgi:hypothetical protein